MCSSPAHRCRSIAADWASDSYRCVLWRGHPKDFEHTDGFHFAWSGDDGLEASIEASDAWEPPVSRRR
jgi:hypothetical protein